MIYLGFDKWRYFDIGLCDIRLCLKYINIFMKI